MATQIPFPEDANFPPERPQSRQDIIIDNLYQVLPAASIPQMRERLAKRGLKLSEYCVRHAIKHLRKYAELYLWTIPHVHGGRITGEKKYFALLLEKDQEFYTDPAFKGHLRGGTASIVTRISTESKNQSVMLGAAATAIYLSKPLREELTELADECTSVHRKARRVLRYLKASNG